jgi:hypothetical protein
MAYREQSAISERRATGVLTSPTGAGGDVVVASSSGGAGSGLTGVMRQYLVEKRRALEDTRLLALVGAAAGYFIGSNTG